MRLWDLLFITAICAIALYLVSCTIPTRKYVYLEEGDSCTVLYKTKDGQILSVEVHPNDDKDYKADSNYNVLEIEPIEE